MSEGKWLPCGYPELNRGQRSRMRDELLANGRLKSRPLLRTGPSRAQRAAAAFRIPPILKFEGASRTTGEKEFVDVRTERLEGSTAEATVFAEK